MLQGLRENIGVVVVQRPRSTYPMLLFILGNFLVFCFAIGLGLILNELILVVIGLVAILCFIGILEEYPHMGVNSQSN